MSCTRPLKGFPIGTTVNGKTSYKIVPFKTDFVWFDAENEKWRPATGTPYGKYSYKYVDEYVEIPCGKCPECRLRYSRDWANRCMCEAQYHKGNYFLTLTYDDEHLPINRMDYDGDLKGDYPSLRKADLTKFMKDLREAYLRLKVDDWDNLSPSQKKQHREINSLKFFSCGEYGPSKHRPHYHLIVFGLQLDDLQLLSTSAQGFSYYRSAFIEKLWPKGFSLVCEVSWETCAYVARYCLKKGYGKKDDETIYPWEDEFINMSRRPGIGYQFFKDKKQDLFKFEYVSVPSQNGAIKIRNIRYYDKLFDIENPEDFIKVKEKRRKVAEIATQNKMAQTSLEYSEQLKVDERNKIEQIKVLQRKEL